MSFSVGDTGKVLRAATGFNMASMTELSLFLCAPDGTSITKTTADGVVLGTVAVTDPDVGALLANEYVEYPVESDVFIDGTAGTWSVQVLYTDTVPVVDDNIHSRIGYFEVFERCNDT